MHEASEVVRSGGEIRSGNDTDGVLAAHRHVVRGLGGQCDPPSRQSSDSHSVGQGAGRAEERRQAGLMGMMRFLELL